MAVIFDCSSSMAMFRKPYTTTSSVSFAFPPPSAVAGLISAIIGIDNGASQNAARANYWDSKELQGTRIALSIVEPIRWLRGAVNFWNVKQPQKTPHIQVKHQFVASPKYRIFVEGGVEARLRKHLKERSFVYTPYLGVAYAIAQIDYLETCSPQPVEEGEVMIDSLLPWGNGEGIKIDIGKTGGVFSEIVPFRMSKERGLTESIKVVYPAKAGHPVHVKERGALNVSRCVVPNFDGVVAWFPEW